VVTLWIGDFRTRQLQNIYQVAQQTAEYHYLVDDFAEYSWFKDNAIAQLPTMSLESANIIVMLGLNDCIYSCVWDYFKIDEIAKQYATAVNELVSDYPNFKIYVCSVNPIDGNYPFAESKDGFIAQKQLDEKFKLFNSTLESGCQATYIDTYTYLTETSFTTRDGIRFTPDTCSALHSYISSNLSSAISAAFLPRISAPDSEVDSYSYWEHTSKGGVNPFSVHEDTKVILPNSAAYAWGRFYEILGEVPTLSTGAAKTWYGYADGYKRGDTPRIGAIACWTNNDTGFVAVVEQVKADGTIITSESGWDSEAEDDIWRLAERTKGDGNWGMPSYTFQGFIYGPQTVSASKEEICTKNSYSISIDEMKPNAKYIYQYLNSKGWTINAVAGLLGNLQEESKMSPAIWESLIDGTNANGTLNMTAINNYYNSHGRYPGFGLVQWTPYSKYTDWCAEQGLVYWDIDSQLQRIDYEAEQRLQWISRPSKGYDLTFNEFISSTRNAAWLAAAFAFCYERPARSTGTEAEQNALRAERGANGDFWYNYLSTLSLDVSSTRLKISNFKVDECLATQVSVSFLANSTTTIECSLLKNGSQMDSKNLSVKMGYNAVTFKNLVPNTEYIIQLKALDADDEILNRELSFTTPQDYPQAPKKVELLATDKILSKDSFFTLNIAKPNKVGYWKANSGYDIILFINNKSMKTITVNSAGQDLSWQNFSIEDKFDYQCKTGDLVQVGARVWVKDSSNRKLYDSVVSKRSKSICLLNKPIRLYLSK
jgi:surface antigen